MIIPLKLEKNSYDIVIERGCLNKAGEYLSLNRKVLVVTDDGVPSEYARTLASFCAQPYIVTLPQGEKTKCFASYMELCEKMISFGFTRTDCVVAIGGGVIGDLAGFVAAPFFLRWILPWEVRPLSTLEMLKIS